MTLQFSCHVWEGARVGCNTVRGTRKYSPVFDSREGKAHVQTIALPAVLARPYPVKHRQSRWGGPGPHYDEEAATVAEAAQALIIAATASSSKQRVPTKSAHRRESSPNVVQTTSASIYTFACNERDSPNGRYRNANAPRKTCERKTLKTLSATA